MISSSMLLISLNSPLCLKYGASALNTHWGHKMQGLHFYVVLPLDLRNGEAILLPFLTHMDNQ
jgi:hypothetical protein